MLVSSTEGLAAAMPNFGRSSWPGMHGLGFIFVSEFCGKLLGFRIKAPFGFRV